MVKRCSTAEIWKGVIRLSSIFLFMVLFQLQEERDELHDRFVQAILEVQQKTGVKNILLQKRIQTLSQITEHRDVVIGELTLALKQSPDQVNKKLEVSVACQLAKTKHKFVV